MREYRHEVEVSGMGMWIMKVGDLKWEEERRKKEEVSWKKGERKVLSKSYIHIRGRR